MQLIIIIAILLFVFGMLTILLNFNTKKIKEIGKNEVLDELVKKFPDNIQICKYILKKLGNTHTKIKEDDNNQSSLYLVMNDTISIANIKDTYTRVQTIAHECLHSIQSKKMLWFNFIYSNIFIFAYIIIMILTMCNIINNGIFFISILLIMILVHYMVRSYLEIDAMIKAKYLAREYMEENKLTTKGNIEIIIKEYDKLNNIGIKATCYSLISKQLIKIIIYAIVCIACKA